MIPIKIPFDVFAKIKKLMVIMDVQELENSWTKVKKKKLKNSYFVILKFAIKL